jgi:hypothetical protein
VAGLAEGVDDEGEGSVEHEGEAAGIHHLDLLRRLHQHAAEGLAPGPAAERGDAILGGHRRAVVELEALAQGESPGQPVLADLPALEHLRVVVPVRVDRDEGVEDHVGEDAGRVDRGDDRVEDLQLRVERHADDLVLRARGAGGRQQRERRGEEDAPHHARPSALRIWS